MENKKDSLGKTKKQPSKIFATNFFSSLYFLNESLINNKSIGVLNKQCTETLKENTPLLPEESVKSPRERHKNKSSCQKINILSSKETATKHITSTEEKKKKHQTNDNDIISEQNWGNDESFGQTVIKENRKRHKHKLALKEHDIVAQKDMSLELSGKSKMNRNEFASLESVQSVTNLDILSEECIKEKKKRSKDKSAFLEIDHQNIVENEENIEDGDLIGLIKRMKKQYENGRKSSKEEVKMALKFLTNGEENQKEHKTNFDEYDYESTSAQNEENFKVLDDTVIKEKKKRHKNKSAFKEHLSPKDTSLEVLDENVKHKAKIFKDSVQNATNGAVLGEYLVKEKEKHPKTQRASTEFVKKNFVIQNEKSVKNKTDQTEFSDIAEDNDNSIQEDHVKKKKKHKRRNVNIEKEEEDNALFENINSIQEGVVKKKKKHKRRNADIEKEEKNINSIQEDAVKKKEKHKSKNADIEKDNALFANINSVQEDVVKKKKKHKRTNADIKKVEKDSALLENINYIQEDVKKKKKHKRRNADIEKEEKDIALLENINSIQEDVVEKKKKHKKRNADIEKEEKDNALFENINSIQEDVVKKKEKHKRRNADVEKEEKDSALFENINSIQDDLVKKKKKHKRKKSNIEDNDIILEDINYIHEDPVKKKKKDKTKNSEVAENNDTSLMENAIFVKKMKHKRKNSDIAEEKGASLIENVDSIQEGHVENKKKYKRGFSETLEDDENLNFTLKDSVKKMKKLNMDLYTLVEGKNNEKNNYLGSEKPIKGKRQKYKLFAADEYLALQSHANIEFGNNEEMEQKGKSTYSSFNDQIHKTQNNVGLHLSDNKKKKEVSNLEQLIQQSSDEESENCLINTQQTMTVIQNEKNVMTSKPFKKKKKDQTEFCDVREDNDTSFLKNIDLVLQDNPVKKKKKHKRKNSDVENEDKDTIVLENKDSIQEDPGKKKKQRRKEKQEEESRFKDENKSMPTRLNSEDEDDEILLQGTPLSIDVTDLDLNEDPVDFEIPLLHSHEKACQLKLEEKEALKSQGVVIKTGKFTAYEVSLLRRNYNDFTKRFQINDPQILLGIGQTSRKKDVMAFLRAKHFYVRLGKDLPDRQLFSIYRKARLLFHHLKTETKLDKEDVNRLRRAHSRMGSKWQAIGNILNKSADTARQAFLWHDKSINRGRWTEEEENQLISAIKTVTGKTNLSSIEIEGAILWEKVADLVPSRNSHQCRCHWNEHLSCKFKTVCWNKKDYGKLVSILRKGFYVDDFVDINWREVQKCFGDTSWQFLRKKWYLLAKMFRDLKKDDSKVIPYKKILDHYCIAYNIKTD